MKSFILLLFLSNVLFAQTLPKKDKGLSLSLNLSNRHLPYFTEVKPMLFPNIEYKWNRNFKNNFSIKSGASLFVVGHKFEYTYSIGYYPSNTGIAKAKSVYGYLRCPLLFSYNIKRFYFDIGAAPCFRLFYTNNYSTMKSAGSSAYRFIYTLEAHAGYYIPVKQQRFFIECATYFSEINAYVFLPSSYSHDFKNTYSQNFQISIGYMFGKLKSNTELVK
jgi:hypothetical protein